MEAGTLQKAAATPGATNLDQAIEQIAGDAAFLWERLDWPPDMTAKGPDLRDAFTRWSQVVGGSEAELSRRLAWDGLSPDGVRLQLAHAVAPQDVARAPWVQVLREMVEAGIAAGDGDVPAAAPDADPPLPFQDVLRPAVTVARRRLAARGNVPAGVWSGTARAQLERALLDRLCMLAGPVLAHEFVQHGAYGEQVLRWLQELGTAAAGTASYRAFVTDRLADGGLALYRAYPVLARLLAVAVIFWVEQVHELQQRLHADRDALAAHFADGRPLGAATDVQASLSDPHGGGRTVVLLAFESGLRLVYKPKAIDLEAAFQRVLQWCNERGPDLQLRVLRVLERPGYGWVEFVEHRPCEDAAAAARFYRRAGMLACLLHALRATDCHRENLVASGEHLVLVDMETLLHHEACALQDAGDEEAFGDAATDLLWNSVLRTGLLPRWHFSADRREAHDVSGLGSGHDRGLDLTVRTWCHVNTDAMHLRAQRITLPAERNLPVLAGRTLSPYDHQPALCEGFAAMHRLLQAHAGDALRLGGPLAALQGRRVRFIFRDTQFYANLMGAAHTPAALKNGIDFGIELEHLGRAFLVAAQRPAAWPLVHAERLALAQSDVPLFLADTASDALSLDDGTRLPGFFARPSQQDMAALCGSLDEADLARQTAILRSALQAGVASVAASVVTAEPVACPAVPANDAELLAQAVAIGHALRARAVPGADGSLGWLGLAFVPQASRYQLVALGDNLYDGRGGVALFLAALWRATGDTAMRDLAQRSLQPARRWLHGLSARARERMARSLGLGAGAGLGSLVYAFVRAGQWLDDPALIDDAAALAGWIDPALVAADRRLDVLGGAAGAALGLLALAQARPDGNALAQAQACGHHLLAQRKQGAAGAPRGWLTIGERALTGFSHGAAGIVHALERLHLATGEPAFLQAASEGLAYERSLFDEQRGNWPDLRDTDDGRAPKYLVQWCHGACGIGLARLAGGDGDDPALRQREIDAALGTTARLGLQQVDHLCCGNAGRLETLLEGARRRGQPALETLARQQAAAMLERARQRGGFRLFGNLPEGVFNPGLFQGVSGIGYTLLRLADRRLPNVLLWQ